MSEKLGKYEHIRALVSNYFIVVNGLKKYFIFYHYLENSRPCLCNQVFTMALSSNVSKEFLIL